jgi:hypothetical protein
LTAFSSLLDGLQFGGHAFDTGQQFGVGGGMAGARLKSMARARQIGVVFRADSGARLKGRRGGGSGV